MVQASMKKSDAVTDDDFTEIINDTLLLQAMAKCDSDSGPELDDQPNILLSIFQTDEPTDGIESEVFAFKPRADVTRSPKQGYQWPHKKDMCPPKFKKKRRSFCKS